MQEWNPPDTMPPPIRPPELKGGILIVEKRADQLLDSLTDLATTIATTHPHGSRVVKRWYESVERIRREIMHARDHLVT